jgi:hypothetical protein
MTQAAKDARRAVKQTCARACRVDLVTCPADRIASRRLGKQVPNDLERSGLTYMADGGAREPVLVDRYQVRISRAYASL